MVNILVDAGTISKDEAIYHPQKNILLQAVGVSDALKISFTSLQMNNGIVLLCSDGLYNSLLQSQIVQIISQNKDLESLADELLDEANAFGGKDNIGFAICKLAGC